MDLHAEVFMGNYANTCILLQNSRKNKMVNGIDKCYKGSIVKCQS